MVLDGAEKVIGAVGSALAAVLAPIGVIYAASINRSHKSAEASVASLTIENERLEDDLARARDQLSKAEAKREAERESGMAWRQRAFHWFETAHEMRRHAFGHRQAIESAARVSGQPRPVWDNELLMPGFEDPKPAAKPLD